MSKRISASDAKNGFGGMLEDVAALGRVDIVRHGRVVAIVLSPRTFAELGASKPVREEPAAREHHLIPPALARRARLARAPGGFDDDER